jgi:hypothetical protein
MKIKDKIAHNIKNMIGSSVKEKYLIIESDDWGSIRMPSIEALERLKSKGISLEKGDSKRYNNSDTLASKEDFEFLFNTLIQFKDETGNSPVFTALSVVANPDFAKIKENNFEKFIYEPFTKTLDRYNKADAFAMWKKGISEKLFQPEFHGREHLNANVWLRQLQANDKDTHLAFDEGCWAINNARQINYQAAFNVEMPNDIALQKDILATGLDLFEQIHGYKSRFFVPPNGFFNNQLEEITAQKGIKFMGVSKVQKEPHGNGKYKNNFHWLGKQNKHNQVYLTRNAFFEPNAPGKDWHNDCLNDIHYAFKWNKPAVISSHRTNYIGSLDVRNRDLSLKALQLLLVEILKRWPDVKFITSTQLGDIISKNSSDL